jgi:hypothetical protein
MNINLERGLIFGSGLAVGGAVAWLILKKIFTKKERELLEMVDKEEQSLRERVKELEAFSDARSIYTDLHSSEDLNDAKEDKDVEKEKNDRKKDRYSRIVSRIDYTKYGKNGGAGKDKIDKNDMAKLHEDDIIEAAAEMEFPTEDPPLEPAAPYPITGESFSEDCEFYVKEYLTYYEGDCVLADSTDELIDDIPGTVGLRFDSYFGEDPTDPDVIYIRNDLLAIDYEITRVEGSYQELVIGVYE